MPAQKIRLNLILDNDIMDMLKRLAKKRNASVSGVARALLLDGLDLQEDIYFSKLSDKRDNGTSGWISHEEAWK